MSDAQRAKVKNRFVTQISNIVVNGKPIGGLGNAEASWHSDMTYVPSRRPRVCCSESKFLPLGDTYFADQAAALKALPAPLRSRIETLSIKHDAAHTSVGEARRGFEPFDDPRDARRGPFTP